MGSKKKAKKKVISSAMQKRIESAAEDVRERFDRGEMKGNKIAFSSYSKEQQLGKKKK